MTVSAIGILAVADWLIVGQWVFNVLLAIGLAYVGAKNRQVENLQSEVKEYAKQQVKGEVSLLASEVRATLAPLQAAIGQINDRLGRGDQALDQLWDGDRQIELKVAGKVDALKDWMRAEFATREAQVQNGEDLRKLADRFGGLQTMIARIEAERIVSGDQDRARKRDKVA